MERDELVQQRVNKLNEFVKKGFSAYPICREIPVEIGSALDDFKENRSVSFCGRIMARRSHGKAVFFDLADSTGKIQLYCRLDFLGEEKFSLLEYLDIADIIQARGTLFKTHTGEPSLKVEDFFLLAKALRPLPEKWHGLKDPDLRYRQRYLDILTNPSVKEIFIKRTKIIQSVREFLNKRGFLEVETPMMHTIAGGAVGRPFKTYHNEYEMELYLRIAPELYLKRLLVAGLDKVYELNRSFRNEGISTKHNPEFTMLEVYQAYANYKTMMDLVSELIKFLAEKVLGKKQFTYQGKFIDLEAPWQVISFAQVVKERFNIDPSDEPEIMLEKLKKRGFAQDNMRISRSQVTKIIEDLLEEQMQPNPTFVIDYFTNISPLARSKEDNPLLVERFELYIAGIEVANAYTELNDPEEQRKRFIKEIREREECKDSNVDEDYILALEHGMPPAGGLGIGIDRLTMLLTDQSSIREVILFPLLRPQRG